MGAVMSVILPARLDLATVTEVAEQIIAWRGQPLVIDASELRHLGGLGLQLLLAVQATWQADGLPFAVIHPSDAYELGLRTFGLETGHFANHTASDAA
ncbi:MAG: hypothetical protein DI498_09200 [Paracoccus denitrificans]|nr:MAG: hypothetical protein DI498_09200 [Paracoccus denitrificans]PZO84054.1 MAG: hypothetical protein DI633_09200 [Paracoccus denitrificans]